MAAEATTEGNKTELDEDAAKKKAKLQEQQDYLIVQSLNKFEQKDIANIPKTKALSETQIINIYKEIQDNCNQCGFTITPMEKLPSMKFCIQNNHKESPKVITNISRALYRQFTTAIPSTDKIIMAMIELFTKN